MQIKKTYRLLNPELLYHEIRDLVQKQGTAVSEAKLETYSLPTDSSTFISRGTLTFKTAGQDCLRAHILGSARGETKLMLDVDEKLFAPPRLAAFQSDLDFVFGTYEVKGGQE